MSGFRLGVIASAIRTLISQIADDLDIHFSSVSLLLHMTGAHTSTYYADNSASPKTVSVLGGAAISTTQSKFSPSSGFFDGTNDYLTCPTGAAFQFPGDFTVEMWVYSNNITGSVTRALFDCRSSTASSTGFILYMFNAGVNVYSNNANRISSPNLSVAINTWTHVALCRSGTAMTLWVNGQQSGSTYTIATNFSDGLCVIGRDNPSANGYFSGYMDEVRITKGVGRYYQPFTPPANPFFGNNSPNYTANLSLLMHCNGLNGSTVFLDSSPSNKVISIGAGSPSIISTLKKYGTGSLYLDGTGDYLTSPNNADLNFGAGDFTIEGWVFYDTSYPGGDAAVLTHWQTGNLEWFMGITAAGKLAFYYSLNGTTANTQLSAGSILLDRWVHIAVARYGPNITLYINGTGQNTFAISTSAFFAATPLLGIGVQAGGTSVTSRAYFDDLRITKNAARYTGNFNPPSAQFLDNKKDPYFEHVVLLLHGEGTDGAQVFTDSSLYANTATVSAGVVETDTAVFKYGASSIFLNSGRVYFADSDLWWFSDLDFTIECWVYRTVTSANRLAIFAQEQPGGGDGSVLLDHNTSGILRGSISVGGTTYIASALAAIATSTWYHIALVRKSTSLYFFLNGVLQQTTTVPVGAVPNTANKIAVGGYGEYVGSSGGPFGTNWLGYIDDFRITKGIARYTKAFVPPYSQLPAVTATVADPFYENVALLLHCNGANGSTSVPDSSQAARTISVSGNAQVSTAQSVFGLASLIFDGTTDFVFCAHSTDFQFGNGPFTVELWIRFGSIAATVSVLGKRAGVNFAPFSLIYNQPTGKLMMRLSTSGAAWIEHSTVTSPVTNTWYHYAYTRDGDVCRWFLNGVLEGTASLSTGAVLMTNTDGVYIGASSTGVQSLNGYMDEIRITKGVARYIKAFTPAIQEHPSS